MKIILENTETILEIEAGGGVVPARVWEGHTADGVPVVAFITRISPQTHDSDANAAFARELVETARPSLASASGAIPLRLVL